MKRPQHERVLDLLLTGRRLTVRQLREETGIECIVRCIHDLRQLGVPVASIWCDPATGSPLRDDRGRILWWDGHWHAARQPPGSVAAYQLYCQGCREIEPSRLGWKPQHTDEGLVYDLREFRDTYLCPGCFADQLCSV